MESGVATLNPLKNFAHEFGTAGLRAIKAAGGLTFAQSEASAKFDAMPRSAIRAGFVDAALPPREIAHQ